MTQLSFMDAVDAALPHGFACGSWWWHAWKAGDAIPPGWRPPVPGADYPKPRLPAEAPPGAPCENDEIDIEVAKAVDAWLPDGMGTPFIGIHQTRRLACGAAWARLEAWDGGLCHATVRDGLIEWEHVPGAGALVALDGRWTRLPAEEARDAHWTEPGDAIPPGYTPPIAGEVRPGWDASHGGMRDRQIVSDVLEVLLGRFPPGIPFPWEGVVETHRYPDGAVWASLRAVHDGALSHLTLRDGVLEWSEAPGAGLLTYARETRTWGRLPAKKTWNAEALAAASALPDVVVPEKEPSALPDAEAIETSASAPSDVEPEPAVPVALPLPSGGPAAFLHAHNLATDTGWKGLADSLSRTTPGDVRNAVARHVAGGSLSAANAAALLACIEATEPPAELVTEAEFPEVDLVDGSRPVLRAPDDFMENLARARAAAAIDRAKEFCLGRALVEAGLAEWKEGGVKPVLMPPASDVLHLHWQQPMHAAHKHRLLLLDDTSPDHPVVRRVEEITRLRARPAERRRQPAAIGPRGRSVTTTS